MFVALWLDITSAYWYRQGIMESKTATFGPGPLGIRMKGSPLGIKITYVDVGSAAMNSGVKIGAWPSNILDTPDTPN